jgi:hypothetical protein
LGTLQLVKSVTTQEVRLKDVDLGKTQAVNSVYSEPGKNCTMSTMEDGVQTSQTTENKDNDYNPINDLDLSGLTTQQQVMVKQMLEEEKESFSTSDDDRLHRGT